MILHHRQRPNDNGWKTWTDGGRRAQQRRTQAGAEGEEGWEDDDSDEGWGDDSDDLEGLDEDDGMDEKAVDGPGGFSATGESVALVDVTDIPTAEVST